MRGRWVGGLIDDGEAFEGETQTWTDMDGIGLCHSCVGELTYIDLSGLCQGDKCLISTSRQMPDSSAD